MPNSDPNVTYRDISELSDLVVTGELSLQETGRIVTSTATGTQRIVISSTATDRITFYSDSTKEASPAYTYGVKDAITNYPYLEIKAAASTDYGTASSIRLYPQSIGVYAQGSLRIQASSSGTKFYNPVILNNGIAPAASTFDPVLQVLTGTTQPDVGTGANAREDGIYARMGALVQAHVTITWSSDGAAGNGVYVICPPKSIHSDLIVGGSVGGGRVIDASGADTWVVDCRKAGSTKVNLRFTGTTGSNVTNTSPFTCGSSDDQFDLHLNYLTTEA